MTGFNEIDLGIEIFNYFILFFAISVMGSYVILAIISAIGLKKYLKHNRYVNYDSLLFLKDAPKVSLLAPAYNEGRTIEENVKSLLGIKYNNFEVIVINDGSKDDSVEILAKAFELVKTDDVYHPKIPTKNVRGIYKSTNPVYSNLVLIDKENGGKADALNTGINFANNPYVVCIDVDCIMDKDVLLKLAKPFLEYSDKRIIATGGVVRIANSCEIKSGKLVRVFAPENWLARIQVLEYLRAFILGRMAWSQMDGLLLISGAFGMFDKDIVIASGGYNTNTVGEDMELVVRMRRYMIETKQEYRIQYIPDPLCWTEAPESFQILRKQRSRWTRGTIETLFIHRKMLFNPKYKILGMVSFPYWTLYEFLAPIIEATGLLITFLFACLGILKWSFFVWLLLFVYSFAVMFSFMALYAEESTFKRYQTFTDLFKLIFVALIEPIYFHPFTVYAALKGNYEKIKGTHGWGDMTRKGFTSKTN